MQSTFQEPTYLVMQPLLCAYCRHFGDKHSVVSPLFGIISCDEHKSLGARDCNAWLHKNRRVRFRDALAHPALKPFFDVLPPTFPTIRSSGARDDGWFLPKDGSSWDAVLCVNSAGLWSLPIEKQDGPAIGLHDNRITRSSSFQSFLEMGVPGITPEIVAAATTALDVGLYKAHADAQAAA